MLVTIMQKYILKIKVFLSVLIYVMLLINARNIEHIKVGFLYLFPGKSRRPH
jgi:hypothetical protein